MVYKARQFSAYLTMDSDDCTSVIPLSVKDVNGVILSNGPPCAKIRSSMLLTSDHYVYPTVGSGYGKMTEAWRKCHRDS